MNPLKNFNTSLRDFVEDLKNFDFIKKEAESLETFIEVTKINARLIIRGFQSHLLRDIFVVNVLKNNFDYFLKYDVDQEFDTPENIKQLIKKIQKIVYEIQDRGETLNTEKVFHWLKVLCFYAYSDLGIDAANKFKELLNDR